MDRHTENFGFLRDIDTGEIISLAPNYDNNIALIAKGYPTDKTRKNDGLIRFLREFIQSCDIAHEMYRELDLPEITEEIISECLDEIPIEVDREFIIDFILNGQNEIKEIINQSEDLLDDEDFTMGFML